MEQALRVIFLVLHIIFAGMAIAQVPVAIWFRRQLALNQGRPGELPLMATRGQIMGGLGTIGGIGLLITGLVLTGILRLGLLGLAPTPTWLLVKQVVYIVILVLVVGVLTPRAQRSRGVVMAAAKAGEPLTDELRETSASTERVSLIINALTLINIILAVWKPTA